MTGIFQIFDRYKAKASRKVDSKKAKNGEPETSPIPPYDKEESVGKKASRKGGEQRQSQSEASRDSPRSSSADMSEVVVKSLTFPKEIHPDTVRHLQASRSYTDPRKPLKPCRYADGIRDESSGDDSTRLFTDSHKPHKPHRPRKPHQYEDETRNESSGDERGYQDQRPYPFSDRKEVRRQHYQSSADERGGSRYYSATEIEERRQQSAAAGRDGRRYQSFGFEERGKSTYSRDGQWERDHNGLGHSCSHHHIPTGLNERQKHQSSGDERSGYINYSSSGRGGSRHQTSASKFEGRRYQTSGDERGGGDDWGGHRFNLSTGHREGGKRQDPVLKTSHRIRNEFLDEDRERFAQYLLANVRQDGRRHSSATDIQRRSFVDMEDGRRDQGADVKKDCRYRSFGREGRRLEPVSVTRDARRQQHLNYGMNDDWQDGLSDGTDDGSRMENFAAVKEGYMRERSVGLREEHTRQSILPKESVRHHLSAGTRTSQPRDRDLYVGRNKELPPRSSGSRNTLSPRSLIDIRDLARLTVEAREGYQLYPPAEQHYREQESSQFSLESHGNSTLHYDFRETLRAIDVRDAQRSSEKGRDGSRSSFDGREQPRMSSVSRISLDSRHNQSTTPRLSMDGREHLRASNLHSSRASSIDGQSHPRTNSMDSTGSGENKMKGPGVVARLMGLADLPDLDSSHLSSDRPAVREGKSLQKLLNSTPPAESVSPASDRAKFQLHLSEVALQMKQVTARLNDADLRQIRQLQQETQPKRKFKVKVSTNSRSRSPPRAPVQQDGDIWGLKQSQRPAGLVRQGETNRLHSQPKQPMSPRHHQMEGMPNAFRRRHEDFPPGDVDQRLHQLRIKNSIQEHKTLKQILEAMHLKGLLHPPENRQPKFVKSQKLGTSREAQRPLQDTDLKPSSSSSSVARPPWMDIQGAMEGMKVQDEPTVEADHTGEASIVVMKPLNHQFVNAQAQKDVENHAKRSPTQLAASIIAGLEGDNLNETRTRGRSSERRAMPSGKASRAHASQELPEQFTEKPKIDEEAFASVMLSWREQIAAESAKRAVMELAEEKMQLRPVGPLVIPAGLRQRSRDSSPSRSGSASKSGNGRMVEKPRTFGKQDIGSVREPEAPVVTVQLETCFDEETSKTVGRSKSDRHVVTPSPEAVESSFSRTHPDRVPAQVAVLRSKRSTSKANRSKEKGRSSAPKDLLTDFSISLPRAFNIGGECTTTDQYPLGFSHELAGSTERSDSVGSNSASKLGPVDDSRITPKKRKIEEPSLVNVELYQPPPLIVTPEPEIQALPLALFHQSSAADIPEPSVQCVASPPGLSSSKPQHVEVDVAVDDGSGGNTPRDISLPKYQCAQEESGFILEGADHPSPVSVLDSPIFQDEFHSEELSPSSNSVKSSIIRPEDPEVLMDIDEPACDPEAICSTPPPDSQTICPQTNKDISDPLKDIYTKVARSLELSDKDLYSRQTSVELQIPLRGSKTLTERTAQVSLKTLEEERVYVQHILVDSGLIDDTTTTTSGAVPEIIHFDVFTRKEEELQLAELDRIDSGELDKSEEQRYKESLDRRLIFDCMNEILGRKMSPFLNPQPWGTPVMRMKPSGQLLVDDVWDELQDMHWPVTDAYDALYALLQKDFARKEFQWLDFSVEVGDVGCQVELMIFEDMVEEAVKDAMSIQEMRKSSPLPSPLAPPTPPTSPQAPAPRSDDSESRRRELLEKTRRDLLAWQQQYQQM